MKFNQYAILALALLVLGTGVRADSELDGPKKVPSLILQQLNHETQTVTQFKVDAIDASVSPEALKGLSDAERTARIDAFVKKAAKPENKISEEKVEKVGSELDSDGSTAACWWRWRGSYSGNYYGGGYYGYYGGYRSYYTPAWNYGYNYGYYAGGYSGGYYGNSYYGGGYNNCYYSLYSNYGW